MVRGAFVFLLLAIGCGEDETNMLPQDSGVSVDSGVRTDQQVCDQGCSALIGCGVLYDNSCSSNCQTPQQATLRGCWRDSAQDCNALALCVYEAAQPLFCPGGGGVPAGTGTCNELRMCNAGCFTSATPAPCGCACTANLDSSKAINALIDSVCSATRCTAACMVPSSSQDCLSCQGVNCQSEAAQCVAN